MPRDHVEQYSLGAASEFRRQTAAEHTPLEDGAVQLYADSRDGQAPFLAEMTGREPIIGAELPLMRVNCRCLA
jgi:hypothetical protein